MELLAPAGNYYKMLAAIKFGADAVYFSGKQYGLRASAGNFSMDEMEQALKYLHSEGKKGYVTVNIFPTTEELEGIEKYLKDVDKLKPDGLIISDPGIFHIAKESNLKTPLSISTQANTTNVSAVNFWAAQGADRVIMAREIFKNDLVNICKKAKCEVEVFVHGAICISMSGRCLISSYMNGKDANHGECTQPCRWNYHLVENTRRDRTFEIEEDERGTYLYNSKDLSMIEKMGELYDMGIASAKIEGRMKSMMYLSIVTSVYRAAIDRAKEMGLDYVADVRWIELLASISNRGYITGFYDGKADDEAINDTNALLNNSASFLATVESSTDDEITILARAKFAVGDSIDVFAPGLKESKLKIDALVNVDGNSEDNTRPNYRYKIKTLNKIEEGSLLLKYKDPSEDQTV